MKYLSLLFVLLAASIASATDIPGGDVSGIWTSENSPYVVQGNIRLNDLQTLVIEPGVEVQFNGPYSFRVKGNLLAQGAPQDSITFINSPGTTGWKGFKMDSLHVDSDSLRLSKCKISGLYQANNFILDGKMVLEDSRVYNNLNMYSGVFYLVRGAPVIRNCVFQNNATASQTDGGAIYMSDSSPLIENCTFNNNSASYSGGALSIWRYNVVVTPIIKNNLFLNNNALSGGAIVLHNFVTPIIEGNQFIGNTSSFDGGAVWMSGILGGTVLFKDNLFENNTSSDDGGAVYLRECRARFENNEFKGNSANSQGGALFLEDEIPLIEIEDCLFSDNSANSGGGLYLGDNSTLNINRCKFINNSATTGAGMNITYYNTVNVANTELINNSASSSGGAFSLIQFCPVNFYNCTIANNKAATYGGAFGLYWDSDPVFHNCIFWGNETDDGPNTYWVNEYIWHTCEAAFYNCNVEGGTESFIFEDSQYLAYENCIETDPLFLSPTALAGNSTDASFAWYNVLAPDSPCLDAGGASTEGYYLGETDLNGNPRIGGEFIDIGAYEGGDMVLPPSSVLLEGPENLCEGAEVVLSVSAEGLQPFTYAWFNGENLVGSNETYSTSIPGQYRCEVGNIAGTTSSEVLELAAFQFPAFEPAVTHYCGPENLASIEVLESEEYSGFTFAMGGQNTTNSILLEELESGMYTINVVSAEQCETTIDVEILAADVPLTMSTTFEPSTCGTCADGSISSSAEGGYGMLTYSGPEPENLPAGIYQLCYSDELGCSVCSDVSVNIYYSIADLNGDAQIDASDFLSFISDFACTGPDCIGDLNNDQVVNSADLLLFLSYFN